MTLCPSLCLAAFSPRHPRYLSRAKRSPWTQLSQHKRCWATARPGLAALCSGMAGEGQLRSEPAASSSPFRAFGHISGLSRASAEVPTRNKGLTREPRVSAALIFGCELETLDSMV